jgi:hypothetical protein
MIFIGHTPDGANYLGAATLGCAVCNITGYAVTYGFNTSLDTLMSRLHGSKKYAEAGVYAEAALLCMTAAVLPVGLLWWHSSVLLHNVLRLPIAPALMAQTWTRIILAGLWPTLVSDVLRRWLQVRPHREYIDWKSFSHCALQGQQCAWPVMAAQAVALGVNVSMNYVLVIVLHKGLAGGARPPRQPSPPLPSESLRLSPTFFPSSPAAWVAVMQKWADLVVLVALIVARERALDRCLPVHGERHTDWAPDARGRTQRTVSTPRRMVPPFAPLMQRLAGAAAAAAGATRTARGVRFSSRAEYLMIDDDSRQRSDDASAGAAPGYGHGNGGGAFAREEEEAPALRWGYVERLARLGLPGR